MEAVGGLRVSGYGTAAQKYSASVLRTPAMTQFYNSHRYFPA